MSVIVCRCVSDSFRAINHSVGDSKLLRLWRRNSVTGSQGHWVAAVPKLCLDDKNKRGTNWTWGVGCGHLFMVPLVALAFTVHRVKQVFHA